MYQDRVKLGKRVLVGYDRFGDEQWEYQETELPAPVAIQQQTSVEKDGGEWRHRILSEHIVISHPGYLLDDVAAKDVITIAGEDWEVQGRPIHHMVPIKHSEVIVKRVDG